jgi:molecular chaperone HscB
LTAGSQTDSAERLEGHDRVLLPAKCGTCERPVDSPLICSNCHTLLATDAQSYFELFGLPPQFELDAAEVRRRYLELSREVHPDRLGGDPAQQVEAQRVAARLNAAYATLTDPLARAEYLLEHSGGASAAQDKTVAAAVLAESLELSEQIAEARSAGDSAVLANCRTRIRAESERRGAEIAARARLLPGDESLRAGLRAELNAAKYYLRLREALEKPE